MRAPLIVGLAVILATAWIAGCGGDGAERESAPVSDSVDVAESTTGGGSPSDLVEKTPTAEVTEGEGGGEAEDDSVSDALAPGTVQLFYRVSFGTDTQRLPTTSGDITWETSGKGIVRYVPKLEREELVKSISSPSYAKSGIQPITSDGRLFTIRDWGADWTAKDTHFSIEQLDPDTGRRISETDINAEWFTIFEDMIYFKSEVKTDLFGKVTGGGRLMVKELGAGVAVLLLNTTPKLRAVGGKLVSIEGSELREHDPQTGEVRSSRSVPRLDLEATWPWPGSLYYGDDAIYWAEPGGREIELEILRMAPDGATETLFTAPKGPDVSSVVIDQSGRMVVVGMAGSSPPRGLGIKRILLYDMQSGLVETLEVEGHIPLGQSEAGGGLQVLVTP